MNFGIIGGGFGIYGWLSALSQFETINILTLSRYKNIFLDRTDIDHQSFLTKKIIWLDNESLLFENIDILIIARRPNDQVDVIKKLIKQSWKGSLIIEKPIAPSSQEAKKLVEELNNNSISFQVGFSIMETNWSERIKNLILNKNIKKINIEWNFHAHHYKDKNISWKSNPTYGGGSLSFYSIHFIAWLSSFSDWNVISCSPLINRTDDPEVSFQLSNDNTILDMKCNSLNKNINVFKITQNSSKNKILLNYKTPFCEKVEENGLFKYDQRVPYLKKIIEKTLDRNFSNHSSVNKHIRLWEQLEKVRNSA